jgi:hypothetical protein
MALVNGDIVIPAGSFNGDGAVADLSVGTLCPEGLNFGTYQSTAPYSLWSSGVAQSVAQATANLRKCTAYTGTDLLGQAVRLTGKGPAFQGVVVQQFNTELDDTNGDGTQVPVVLVETEDFFYVAEPADLETV